MSSNKDDKIDHTAILDDFLHTSDLNTPTPNLATFDPFYSLYLNNGFLLTPNTLNLLSTQSAAAMGLAVNYNYWTTNDVQVSFANRPYHPLVHFLNPAPIAANAIPRAYSTAHSLLHLKTDPFAFGVPNNEKKNHLIEEMIKYFSNLPPSKSSHSHLRFFTPLDRPYLLHSPLTAFDTFSAYFMKPTTILNYLKLKHFYGVAINLLNESQSPTQTLRPPSKLLKNPLKKNIKFQNKSCQVCFF